MQRNRKAQKRFKHQLQSGNSLPPVTRAHTYPPTVQSSTTLPFPILSAPWLRQVLSDLHLTISNVKPVTVPPPQAPLQQSPPPTPSNPPVSEIPPPSTPPKSQPLLHAFQQSKNGQMCVWRFAISFPGEQRSRCENSGACEVWELT